MFRTALFCAATLIASAVAAPTFSAAVTIPTATVPSALPIDLSATLPTQPVQTSSGVPVDAAAVLKDVGQIANATLGATASAQGAASLGDSVVPLSGAAPLDASGLGDTRGGSDVTFNGAITNQDLSAVNTGNSISAATMTNGAVSIGAGSFSGFNGAGNFVMNTGNQNNIQGSLSINVVIPSSSLTGH
jgi:hypothetical protein